MQITVYRFFIPFKIRIRKIRKILICYVIKMTRIHKFTP